MDCRQSLAGAAFGLSGDRHPWHFRDHHLRPEGEGFKSENRDGVLLKHDPGDCIIYRGCELEHWRDPFEVGEGSYQVQVFLHYIDKNGPYYPEYAFDKRPGIAAPHRLKNNN